MAAGATGGNPGAAENFQKEEAGAFQGKGARRNSVFSASASQPLNARALRKSATISAAPRSATGDLATPDPTSRSGKTSGPCLRDPFCSAVKDLKMTVLTQEYAVLQL